MHSGKPTTDPVLSTGTRSFIAGVAVLNVAVLVYGTASGPVPSIQLLFVWFCAFLIGEVMRFRTPTGKGNVSMAITLHLAAVPLVPISMLLPAAWLARTTADLIVMRARWYRALFNACQVTLACFAATMVFKCVWPLFDGITASHYVLLLGALAASWVAYASGIFALPVVMVALAWIDPLAKTAAASFGVH